MHGAPANDFPKKEMAELFDLRAKLKHALREGRTPLEERLHQLDAKMRAWPRTGKNDPFFEGSQELAKHLGKETGDEVIVGFNEFCAPTVDEAIDQAAATGAEQVIVVTPMMTPGGAHSKAEIPEAIEQARRRHPRLSILYAWPFETEEVARFIAGQIGLFISKS
jgi:sirohydrochlorin cobaltochelatase